MTGANICFKKLTLDSLEWGQEKHGDQLGGHCSGPGRDGDVWFGEWLGLREEIIRIQCR